MNKGQLIFGLIDFIIVINYTENITPESRRQVPASGVLAEVFRSQQPGVC